MRKLAPAFILSSIVALSSGAAYGFGDMNKAKKTTSADTVSTQAAAPKASDETTKPSNPTQPNPAMPASTNTPAANSTAAATNGATAMSDACKGLTPNDAAWKANNCSADGGSTTAPATSSTKRSDSLSGDSSSPSPGSSAPGSSGPSK